jgi:hypothetical protein
MKSVLESASNNSGRAGGGVQFSSTVQVYNADHIMSTRPMNPDGRFYDAQMEAYDDDGSLTFGPDDNNEDERAFMDALQHQTREGNGGRGHSYFHDDR